MREERHKETVCEVMWNFLNIQEERRRKLVVERKSLLEVV